MQSQGFSSLTCSGPSGGVLRFLSRGDARWAGRSAGMSAKASLIFLSLSLSLNLRLPSVLRPHRDVELARREGGGRVGSEAWPGQAMPCHAMPGGSVLAVGLAAAAAAAALLRRALRVEMGSFVGPGSGTSSLGRCIPSQTCFQNEFRGVGNTYSMSGAGGALCNNPSHAFWSIPSPFLCITFRGNPSWVPVCAFNPGSFSSCFSSFRLRFRRLLLN